MKQKRDLKVKQFSIKDLLGKVTDVELAELTGLCRERIRQYREKLAIPRKTQYKEKHLDHIAILMNTKSISELSRQFNVSRHALYAYRKRHNITGIDSRKKHDWEAIKADYDGGMLQRELSRKYGIAQPSMSRGLFLKYGIREWKQRR